MKFNFALSKAYLTPSVRIAVVGCGGTGSFLIPPLVRFLEFTPLLSDRKVRLFLIDPDKVERQNLERQFSKDRIGRNKATSMLEMMEETIFTDRVSIEAMPVAMNRKQGMTMFRQRFWSNGVIVMGCVDNHKSRVYIQEEMAKLKDGIFICGGNGYHDGQVQLWAKSGDRQTAQIHQVHPEMLNTQDNTDGLSCSVRSQRAPQLIWANMACAAAMGSALYRILKYGLDTIIPPNPEDPKPNEIHFDVEASCMRPIFNPPTRKEVT